MKRTHWISACVSTAFFLAAACAPKTENYKAVHKDSQNAQQALDRSIQNHP